MIDEKKIEEAAINASIEDTNKGIVRDGYVISAQADHELGFQEGFKEGIQWFLDNLWHDADERPDKKKIILCEFIDKINNKLVYTDIDLKVEYQTYKFNIDAMCITRWLYIDDLLKGGSHE